MEKGCESGTSPAAYPTWTIRSKIRPFKRENSPTLLVNRGGLVYNQTSSTASPLLE